MWTLASPLKLPAARPFLPLSRPGPPRSRPIPVYLSIDSDSGVRAGAPLEQSTAERPHLKGSWSHVTRPTVRNTSLPDQMHCVILGVLLLSLHPAPPCEAQPRSRGRRHRLGRVQGSVGSGGGVDDDAPPDRKDGAARATPPHALPSSDDRVMQKVNGFLDAIADASPAAASMSSGTAARGGARVEGESRQRGPPRHHTPEFNAEMAEAAAPYLAQVRSLMA